MGTLKSSKLLFYVFQYHRCTRVKNPGEGVPDVFDKIPQGGQGLQEKLPWGWGSTYLGFYCVFINKCFEICPRGPGFILTLPPSPLCASNCI